MVKAVCFDLGGVLVQIHHNWEEALAAAGLDALCAPGIIRPLPDFEAIELFQMARISEDEYLLELSKHLNTTPAEAKRVHMTVLRDAYPGTHELIEELNKKSIITGCLSNTSAPHWLVMLEDPEYANIQSLHHKLASHELKCHKPSAEMYEAFEQAVGVAPDEIVYFDDGRAHVEAAKARGWRGHWIDSLGDTAAQMRTALHAEGVL